MVLKCKWEFYLIIYFHISELTLLQKKRHEPFFFFLPEMVIYIVFFSILIFRGVCKIAFEEKNSMAGTLERMLWYLNNKCANTYCLVNFEKMFERWKIKGVLGGFHIKITKAWVLNSIYIGDYLFIRATK